MLGIYILRLVVRFSNILARSPSVTSRDILLMARESCGYPPVLGKAANHEPRPEGPERRGFVLLGMDIIKDDIQVKL